MSFDSAYQNFNNPWDSFLSKHTHSLLLRLFIRPSLFLELYSFCELILQVSQTLNIGKLNSEMNRRSADNLSVWDSYLQGAPNKVLLELSLPQ